MHLSIPLCDFLYSLPNGFNMGKSPKSAEIHKKKKICFGEFMPLKNSD